MAPWRPLRIFKNPDDDVLLYMGFLQPTLHLPDSCDVRSTSPGVQRLPQRAHMLGLAALIVVVLIYNHCTNLNLTNFEFSSLGDE